MRDYATADFYKDVDLVDDPHAYFDFLRAQGPVTRLPHRNVVAVTGYEETVQVMLDTEHFSSINAVTGPMTELPFKPQGDDIAAELEAARPKIAFADQIVTESGTRHAKLRSVIGSLFTPSRLKALEPSLYATADSLIDEFAADGKVDLVRQYGGPYATLVIADLLGIPAKGRAAFRVLLEGAVPAQIDGSPEDLKHNPLVGLGKHMFRYIAWRRFLNHPAVLPVRRLLGEVPGWDEPDPGRSDGDGGLPVRRGAGHDQPAAGQRLPHHRDPAGYPGAVACRPQAYPQFPGGSAAL
jgi:cytochrome P450